MLPLQIVMAMADVTGRVALPAALLGLSRGATDPALAAALVATGASMVRSFASSRAARHSLIATWGRAVEATRARPFAGMPRRREDEDSVAALLEGIHAHTISSLIVPQVVGLALALAVVAVASFVLLGVATTLAGATLLGVLAGLVALLGRGLRRAQSDAWTDLGHLAREMRVLVEGAIELRATGREAGIGERVVRYARDMAGHEARAAAARARLAVLPASLALVAVAAPLRAGIARVHEALGGGRLFETTIVGGTAVVLAVAAARLWEQWNSTDAARAHYRAYTSASSVAPDAKDPPPTGSLAEVPLRFEGVGHDYEGSGRSTPEPFDLDWPPRSGLAIVGPNGCGKTTVLLALLGVLTPSRGRIVVGGVAADRIDRRALGGRVAYVPQDPLLVPGESIAWHVRLHEDDPPADDAIDAALTRTGLMQTLASRARARGLAVRDLPASELSGGERRRVSLARALARERELYVLDEPEAGLDVEARQQLREILEELTGRARVVVVAHDPATIPGAFRLCELP